MIPSTRQVLSVFCVTCGATAGADCTSSSGRRCKPHEARVGVAGDPDYWRQLEARRNARRVRPEIIVFALSCALGAAIACSGCGDVSAAADGPAGAAGAAGADAEIGGRSGLPGDGGHGGNAPMPVAGAGGAAGAGQGQAGMGGAPATGGAGAPGTDAGQSWAVCPHVVSYAIAVSSHCFQGCQTSTGAIAGSCELSAADAAGWKANSAPIFCVPTSGALPADCR